MGGLCILQRSNVDVQVDLDDNTIQVFQPDLVPLLSLSMADYRFIEECVQAVNQTTKEDEASHSDEHPSPVYVLVYKVGDDIDENKRYGKV